MNDIYIWGTGYFAEHVYSAINTKECVVRGFIDSDKEKQGKLWNNRLVIYSPSQLVNLEYDFIILSMLKFESVETNCNELGIEKNKVIAYWKDFDHIFKNRALNILEEQRVRKIYEYRMDSAPYEWGVKPVPKIESAEKLLKKIIQDKSSLCRFGDGEFEIMRGHERPWFQSVSDTLKYRLIEVLNSHEESINIAVAQNFIELDKFKERDADIIRAYMAYDTRDDIIKFLDMNRTYYDAYVTRPYILYQNKKNADILFPLFKEIWKNRSVIIVEGKYGRIGINNDLFEGSNNIKRVICPHKDAWMTYEKIKQAVLGIACKNDLICISLGPTATVLAYDLAKIGYQAIDIGQVDNEYDWYCMGADKRISIKGKMVAEIEKNSELEDFADSKYFSQIAIEIY